MLQDSNDPRQKSRWAGGSLRTRRLRIDLPASGVTVEAHEMTSTDSSRDDDRRGGLVRRVLSSGPNPEERLEELLAQRRLELDAHAEQLHASIAELERREELLRDSRASVERMLRLGTSDLEAREAELTGYLRELTEREKLVAESEEELGRRRQELGAVELKRAAIERRERARRGTRSRARRARDGRTGSASRSDPSPSRSSSRSFPGGALRARRARGGRADARARARGRRGHLRRGTRSAAHHFPATRRRCAYLVRGARGLEPSSPGSS